MVYDVRLSLLPFVPSTRTEKLSIFMHAHQCSTTFFSPSNDNFRLAQNVWKKKSVLLSRDDESDLNPQQALPHIHVKNDLCQIDGTGLQVEALL